MKIEKTLKTRLFADGDQVETNVTFDLTDLTEADKNELVIRSAAITLQNTWRRKGKIPSGQVEHKVQKPGTRTVGQMTAETLLTKIFGEVEAKKLIEEFGGAEEAKEAVLAAMKARK